MKGCVCVTGVSVYEGVCVCDRCVCDMCVWVIDVCVKGCVCV